MPVGKILCDTTCLTWSSAGKTTLLDVIAGRKTVGKIEGSVLVNGAKLEPSAFQRLIGYVEQGSDLYVRPFSLE